MAKKRPAKKTTETTTKAETKAQSEQIVLGPDSNKALKLIDKSAKVRAELEQAVTLAAAKAVRKVMKNHGITLTPPEASEITSILFGEEDTGPCCCT